MSRLWAAMAVWAALAPITLASAQITPGGIDLQPANSATAEQVHFFHNAILMPVMIGISLFVLALLLWVMIRYNSKTNPTPAKIQPQYFDRSVVDGCPDFDPSCHRDTVL